MNPSGEDGKWAIDTLSFWFLNSFGGGEGGSKCHFLAVPLQLYTQLHEIGHGAKITYRKKKTVWFWPENFSTKL